MITFTEVSALAAAVVLVCTILKTRAPGMTLGADAAVRLGDAGQSR